MADCPLQLGIDALHTTTPNLAHLMADLYIYRTMQIHLWQIDPLLRLSIDALHTTTPNLAHLMADLYMYIEQCTYTYVRLTPLHSTRALYKTITPHKFPPPPIKHRSLHNHYTK